MTFEEFWKKWNPCRFSDWGYGVKKSWENNPDLCKQEMFRDLLAIDFHKRQQDEIDDHIIDSVIEDEILENL